MLRVTAYIIHFITNCKHKSEKKKKDKSAEELADTQNFWIYFIQKTEFERENFQLLNDSRFYSLNLTMTPDKFIILGGRPIIITSNFWNEIH